MPATMPHSAPTMIEPVSQAPPKPQAAPTIIMPSTPRLSTPARSATSSPVAASSSGVEAASTAQDDGFKQLHGPPVGDAKISRKR